jgi:serine/threonine protein kinase
LNIGINNQLDKCQPTTTSELLQYQEQLTLPSKQPQHLSLDSFLDFAIQCCNCLEIIHKQQIVHGEIKLNAFLWPTDSAVKIWNFGSGSRSFEMNLTSEGWRKTVHRNGAHNFLQMLIYMSPEQTGRTTFQPDHRTDLYSLGITFFVALTQSLPFVTQNNSPMEIIHHVLNKKLPFVHQVRHDTPAIISMIIEKLTKKVISQDFIIYSTV